MALGGGGLALNIIIIIITLVIPWLVDVLSSEFPARLEDIHLPDFLSLRIPILNPHGFSHVQAGAFPSRFSLPINILSTWKTYLRKHPAGT